MPIGKLKKRAKEHMPHLTKKTVGIGMVSLTLAGTLQSCSLENSKSTQEVNNSLKNFESSYNLAYNNQSTVGEKQHLSYHIEVTQPDGSVVILDNPLDNNGTVSYTKIEGNKKVTYEVSVFECKKIYEENGKTKIEEVEDEGERIKITDEVARFMDGFRQTHQSLDDKDLKSIEENLGVDVRGFLEGNKEIKKNGCLNKEGEEMIIDSMTVQNDNEEMNSIVLSRGKHGEEKVSIIIYIDEGGKTIKIRGLSGEPKNVYNRLSDFMFDYKNSNTALAL